MTDDFLQRASRFLDSADLLLAHGDFESSVSRSYYAMFFAAEAALAKRGLAFNSHAGVIAAFGEQFVREGPLPRSIGRDLKIALEKRLRSDYGGSFSMTRDDAMKLLASARAFVAAIQGLP